MRLERVYRAVNNKPGSRHSPERGTRITYSDDKMDEEGRSEPTKCEVFGQFSAFHIEVRVPSTSSGRVHQHTSWCI